jgi:hypothetical protein
VEPGIWYTEHAAQLPQLAGSGCCSSLYRELVSISPHLFQWGIETGPPSLEESNQRCSQYRGHHGGEPLQTKTSKMRLISPFSSTGFQPHQDQQSTLCVNVTLPITIPSYHNRLRPA